MISVSMIVKNEESCLAKCLESVRGADEIVIVDTGSTDKTIEIAKKYTDKVFTDYKWNDNFAEARNHALSKCKGQWVFWIDADDRLVTPFENIRRAVSTEDKAVSIKLISGNSHHYFPNLHRRRRDIYWQGAAHNYLTGLGDYETTDDIVIKRGYSPTHKKNPDRTLNILLKEVRRDPSLTRETYYLAREYWYKKDYITAVYWYNEYLKIAIWKPEKADAWLMLARCLWGLQKGQEAREACMQAVFLNPSFKEALLFMARMHYDPMKTAWLKYAKMATNEDVLFIRETDMSTILPKPWNWSNEAIEYVSKKVRNSRVLEWGAGNSTRYFTELYDCEWTAIEHEKGWYDKIKAWDINANIIYADKDSQEYLKPSGLYDLIIVDGRNRVKCLQYAKSILAKNGIVVLHDAYRGKYKEGMKGYEGKYIGDDLWIGKIISK